MICMMSLVLIVFVLVELLRFTHGDERSGNSGSQSGSFGGGNKYVLLTLPETMIRKTPNLVAGVQSMLHGFLVCTGKVKKV
jgi:hypothetical protein